MAYEEGIKEKIEMMKAYMKPEVYTRLMWYAKPQTATALKRIIEVGVPVIPEAMRVLSAEPLFSRLKNYGTDNWYTKLSWYTGKEVYDFLYGLQTKGIGAFLPNRLKTVMGDAWYKKLATYVDAETYKNLMAVKNLHEYVNILKKIGTVDGYGRNLVDIAIQSGLAGIKPPEKRPTPALSGAIRNTALSDFNTAISNIEGKIGATVLIKDGFDKFRPYYKSEKDAKRGVLPGWLPASPETHMGFVEDILKNAKWFLSAREGVIPKITGRLAALEVGFYGLLGAIEQKLKEVPSLEALKVWPKERWGAITGLNNWWNDKLIACTTYILQSITGDARIKTTGNFSNWVGEKGKRAMAGIGIDAKWKGLVDGRFTTLVSHLNDVKKNFRNLITNLKSDIEGMKGSLDKIKGLTDTLGKLDLTAVMGKVTHKTEDLDALEKMFPALKTRKFRYKCELLKIIGKEVKDTGIQTGAKKFIRRGYFEIIKPWIEAKVVLPWREEMFKKMALEDMLEIVRDAVREEYAKKITAIKTDISFYRSKLDYTKDTMLGRLPDITKPEFKDVKFKPGTKELWDLQLRTKIAG